MLSSVSCDFTSHSHLQGGDSDDAVGMEEMAGMDETAPGFSQGFMNETALPSGDVTAGGVELVGANLVVQPHKVQYVQYLIRPGQSC